MRETVMARLKKHANDHDNINNVTTVIVVKDGIITKTEEYATIAGKSGKVGKKHKHIA